MTPALAAESCLTRAEMAVHSGASEAPVKPVFAVLLVVCSASAMAQKFDVTIINRQDNETDYSYVVPGYSNAQSNANVNCDSLGNSVNCNGSGTTTGYSTSAREVSFQVTGATLSLLLPDGRVAVVNCKSKFAERMAGPRGNHRSCRVPLVNNIEADFHGDKAKLRWSVSLDGKKFRSETYEILAVLDKRQTNQ